ncbi:MAG TPA: phosphate regulon sensor histidine kinase PhoR [Steroidobacteraceae bacterium]|nr:phosphate regulon sensor histidine kinase PhoR [Steroidobacteraceae bacterium]
MTKTAWRHLLVLLAALVLAAVIGWFLGEPALAVAAVALVALGLQVRNLLRFEYWLRHRRDSPPPDMSGLWGEAMTVTYRIYRRKVFHKQRVLALLREFRRMTYAMPDGVILLGRSREILWFNRAAAVLLDLKRKADYGIRIDNLVRRPEFIDYVEKGGRGLPPRVHMPQHGDRWLAFTHVSAGESGLQLLIVRDVSAEARVDAMRTDFVANASHELRSPLTVIAGYLDNLVDDPVLDAAWKEPVAEMRRQSERMRGILQDLLELSKLEAAGGEAERTAVDVGGMLALMRREVMARPEHPAEFDLALESDAVLLGAEGELHSILGNLISNAVKYTPVDGRIAVRWWVDTGGGHVEVRDTGIGIPPEHIPRLTERFYRVDAGRSRKLGGSGLGLAIVKHALQRHGGRLQIISQEGKGSVFTCHFPPERVAARAS